MSENWKYQIRVTLTDEYAQMVRQNTENSALNPLYGILRKHGATLICQYDAFAGYVAEAEKQGTEEFPLYRWTKATIENPAKKERYLKSFTVYAGGDEVYAKDIADALEADLKPLVDRQIITSLAKHDTNPANNPQPPAHLR
jgi:hypothetical protein